MAQAAEVLIRAEGLGKTYRSGNTDLVVFSDLEFDVCAGEHLAIIGESGAGKSTLLHLFGGLDRPSKGKIYFGIRISPVFPRRRCRTSATGKSGIVWQNHSLLPEFTAQENVMMPLLIRGVDHAEAAPVSLGEAG